MLQQFRSDAIQDCYRGAAKARRMADEATNPATKSDFLNIERRWLSLARGFEAEITRELAPHAGW
jgi:hypothetical protein